MLDRLKSLPLTIILTVLIWMYAESQVTMVRSDDSLTVASVPVWVSGPPEELAQYNVTVEPQTIPVTVTGMPAHIEAMRASRLEQTSIHVYLDITEEDRPTGVMVYRLVRYVPPQGITVTQPSVPVGFRLTAKAAAATGR
jgi:hypothetical protein